MPITSTHPDYDLRIKQWERCRDCWEGSDAVKEKGTKYLPRLREQDTNDYDAYVGRALFYGATGRTVQGLVGAVFRKEPTIVVQPRYEELSEDITYSGQSMENFARGVQEEVLVLGRVGLLAEYPTEGEGQRAYATLYTAEAITNWKVERIGGKVVTTRVVLKELYVEKEPKDPYEPEVEDQYRELVLIESTYAQLIHRKKKGGETYEVVETIVPDRQGVPLDFIPFVFLNAYSTEVVTEKPPLLDLVEVNLSHYRSSADLEHGAHFTALPTPWAGGFNTDQSLYLGSTKAWVSTDPNVKAGFLEYTGQGLKAIVDLMARKENLMAVLGARLLEEPKRAVEAADTHKIRRSGEEGALLAMVGTVSDALTQLLRWVVWWSGAEEAAAESIEFELNRDFVNMQIDPSYLTALMKAHQSGQISQETFLFNLKRGEVFPPGRTIEEEQDAIEDDVENEMPSTPFQPNVTPFPGQQNQGENEEEDESNQQQS